jgi:hypothetical protein
MDWEAAKKRFLDERTERAYRRFNVAHAAWFAYIENHPTIPAVQFALPDNTPSEVRLAHGIVYLKMSAPSRLTDSDSSSDDDCPTNGIALVYAARAARK